MEFTIITQVQGYDDSTMGVENSCKLGSAIVVICIAHDYGRIIRANLITRRDPICVRAPRIRTVHLISDADTLNLLTVGVSIARHSPGHVHDWAVMFRPKSLDSTIQQLFPQQSHPAMGIVRIICPLTFRCHPHSHTVDKSIGRHNFWFVKSHIPILGYSKKPKNSIPNGLGNTPPHKPKHQIKTLHEHKYPHKARLTQPGRAIARCRHMISRQGMIIDVRVTKTVIQRILHSAVTADECLIKIRHIVCSTVGSISKMLKVPRPCATNTLGFQDFWGPSSMGPPVVKGIHR
jgi:hypothetical protein